jgi:hypothetical protein
MKGAKYMCLDIKKFYLTASLKYFEYMRIPLSLFPAWTVEQCNLTKLALDGWVHIEMQKAVWGLPHAGILANKRLRRKLAPFGYYKSVNTPGLWYHESQPISFTLVVDNFGVKYASHNNVDHLISSIKKTYMLTKDWTGNLYCGITLKWGYDRQTVDISMLGYVIKKLQEYKHSKPFKLQNCPYAPKPKKFGNEAQAPLPTNDSPKLEKVGIKCIQKIVGGILYYAQAVDMTVLMALSSIAVEQTKATEKPMAPCIQLLDYLLSQADSKVRYHALDMIMNIHLDAANAQSRACGNFFMGWMPKDGDPI